MPQHHQVEFSLQLLLCGADNADEFVYCIDIMFIIIHRESQFHNTDSFK